MSIHDKLGSAIAVAEARAAWDVDIPLALQYWLRGGSALLQSTVRDTCSTL